jgi:hypothetical protein
MIEPLLNEQLGTLAFTAGEPDWTEVRRRARRLVARRLAARVGMAAFVGIAVVLTATPALGLRAKLFSSGKPAPPAVVKDFAQLDVAAPHGMAPGVLAGEAREVMSVPLSTGERAVLRVAPTRAHGFCVDLSTSGPEAEGAGGCDRDRSIPFSRGLSIPGPISPQGEILKPPVVIDGDTFVRGAAKVQVRFQDGEVLQTPVVWVSAPIDAGFFVYEVPEGHWAPGHRPTELVLVDESGRELGGAKSLPWPTDLTGPAALSVFSSQGGLREEAGGAGNATVGGGESRVTAVITGVKTGR